MEESVKNSNMRVTIGMRCCRKVHPVFADKNHWGKNGMGGWGMYKTIILGPGASHHFPQ